VHEEGGSDRAMVAARSREVLAVLPHRFEDKIEPGDDLASRRRPGNPSAE
jgi:hypothetical protein